MTIASPSCAKCGDAPLKLVLHCPKCGLQHVDTNEWARRHHRKHLCKPEDGGCGHVWQPPSIASCSFGVLTRVECRSLVPGRMCSNAACLECYPKEKDHVRESR
jgi:hypothetical protein